MGEWGEAEKHTLGGKCCVDMASDRSKDSIGTLAKHHPYYTMAKNLDFFGTYPEILCEATLKDGELVYLVFRLQQKVCNYAAMAWIWLECVSCRVMG